jgi:5'(3')-deoxyribonucleotidase
MKSKIIKIDCDGVLRDLLTQMSNVYNEHYNESINPDDVINFETEKTFTKCLEIDDIHPNEWLFQKNSYKLFLDSSPLPKAKEAMSLLHKKGYYIIIVTNQVSLINKTDTLLWLEDNGIYYDSIFFTDKKNLIKGDIIVDDNIDNLNMCDDERKICIKAPYNKEGSGYEYYDSLYDFVKTLD